MIIISIVLICLELSWWGLLTPLFIIISFLLQALVGKSVYSLRNSTMYWKVKIFKNCLFINIQTIKIYLFKKN